MKNFKIGFLSCLCLFASVQAQELTELEQYKEKYPGQHIVMTKNNHTIEIEMEDGEPSVLHKYEYEYIILDKNGLLSLIEDDIEFSEFETIEKIEAYSLLPKGTKYKKIKADNFATGDAEADAGIFYDGKKVTSFRYPNLAIGSKRYLYYESRMSEPSFPFGHSFYSGLPTEESNFTIIADSSIHVLTRTYHGDIVNVQVNESLNKKERVIAAKADSVLVIKRESWGTSPRYFAPHVLAQIGYYFHDGEKIALGGTIEELHKRYRKNIEEVVNETPNEDLAAIADSLTRGLDSEFDKVQAIYYWVQENIKYVAFEKGIEGFVPRQPNKVINKRFGDCKDMASLIYSMLKSVGVESYLTWIGSRSLPYKYTDFPSSFCDNHMIATYKEGDDFYFLDATNSQQNIWEPTGFIQGKEALVTIGPEEFKVVEVPVADSDKSRMTDSSFISINGRSLTGKSKTYLSGYYKNNLSSYYFSGHGETDDKFIESVTQKGNNSFKVLEGTVLEPKERSVPMVFDFNWEVNNYATSLEDEIYVNMILEKDNNIGLMEADRKSPLELDHKRVDTYTVVLDIPEGYEASQVPEDVEMNSDYISCQLSYEQKDNQIVMHLEVEFDFILLHPENFNTWNEFVKLRKNYTSEAVVLKKIKP